MTHTRIEVGSAPDYQQTKDDVFSAADLRYHHLAVSLEGAQGRALKQRDRGGNLQNFCCATLVLGSFSLRYLRFWAGPSPKATHKTHSELRSQPCCPL